MYLLGLACIVGKASAQYLPTNDTWNYDLNGTDWGAPNLTDCAVTYIVESPINVTNLNFTSANSSYTNYFSYNWAINSFAFLPDYMSGLINYAGVVQYVYQLFGNFGGLYAAEPNRS